MWSSLSKANDAAVSDEPGSCFGLVVSIFHDFSLRVAYKSQSLLLGLDGRVDLSAGGGIAHFVVSVC